MKTPGCFHRLPVFRVALSTASSNRSLEACQEMFPERVHEPTEAKLKGKTVTVAGKPGKASVIDSKQALKNSLAAERILKPHKRAAKGEPGQHGKVG